MRIGIVIPCYNRVASLQRLLASLLEANYGNSQVDLVFSIDYSGSNEVELAVKSFIWSFGQKRLFVHSKNIGLKQNILFCGDLVNDYDAVLILEDDLYVAKDFYNYAKQAVLYYLNDDNIAGISLFSYKYTEVGFYQFYPFQDNCDTFFIQWPSSWGQLWTKRQWHSFRRWLSLNKSLEDINIPTSVKQWTHSWKKYYIAYMVDMDKYFVYPYVSFTNDFGDSGIHHASQSNLCTTSLFFGVNRNYVFRKFEKNSIYVYDCFFQLTKRILQLSDRKYEICFDLYATKETHNINANYVITSSNVERSLLSFSSIHIPFEYNILKNEAGDFFHLISKTEYKEQNLPIVKKDMLRMKMSAFDMIKYLCYKMWKKIPKLSKM